MIIFIVYILMNVCACFIVIEMYTPYIRFNEYFYTVINIHNVFMF